MPFVLTISGRTLVVDDSDATAALDRIVRFTRTQVWPRAGGPDSLFHSYYRIWQHHNRYHSVNLFLWTVEALGRATLPPASHVNRIRRLNARLGRSISASRIDDFYEGLGEYNRLQGRFVRDMRVYLDRVIGGTGTLITVSEITRDASFLTLSVAAGILTGGASTAAEVAAASAGTALLRTAASSFLITQLEHSATNLGRTMAGERVTYAETGSEIVTDAIASLTDAGLGAVVGRFLEPLTGDVTTFARREIERGSLIRGMSLEISNSQLQSAVTGAIQDFMRRSASTVRALLTACRDERNARGYARIFAEGFMQDRTFRRLLEEQIEAIAG